MRVVYGARHRGPIPGVWKAYGQDWRKQLCADEETAGIKVRWGLSDDEARILKPRNGIRSGQRTDPASEGGG